MEPRRKKQTQRQKNLFTMTSGGFVIVVRNNSFIDRTYVVTILKALEKIIIKDYRGLVYFKIKIRLDMRLSYFLINLGASCVTYLFA